MAHDLPDSVRAEQKSLEDGDDQALWQAAYRRLTDERQEEYDRLLSKQAEGALTADDEQRLRELGEEARRLTLKKAHSNALEMARTWRSVAARSRRSGRERMTRLPIPLAL
jgi:hypothetical protein